MSESDYDRQNPLRHHVIFMQQRLQDAVGSIEDCQYEISSYEEAIRELQQRCQTAESSCQSEKLRYHHASKEIDRLYSKYRSIQQDREQSTEENLTLQIDLEKAVHRIQELEKENNGLSEILASAMTLLLEKEDATGANAGMEAADSIDCSDLIWPEDATGADAGMEAADSVDCSDLIWPEDATGPNERVDTWCEMNELFESEPHAKRAKTKHSVDGV
jgi:predicted RNase H-like nuclease (RuvC/YqgF family)